MRLPPLGGWPVLALTTGVAAVSVLAGGPAVDAAVPGLGAFAAGFVGLVGAMVRGVASAITMTVIFLHRDPAAARYLPPADAVFLAAVLAGCLWIAGAGPRPPGSNQLAPYLGSPLRSCSWPGNCC